MSGDATGDPGGRIRERRLALGLTQAQLADRAGVSRALVGSLEAGRHTPAVDSAVRLAGALSTTVERLFAPGGHASGRTATVLGGALPDGALVRAARVDETTVVGVLDPTSALGRAGASADGVAVDGCVRYFAGAGPQGALIAGCDPLLEVAEGLLERAGAARVVGVPATSGTALAALRADRCHGALVHGPARRLSPPSGIRRWHLARWRTGVASHPRLSRPSLETLLGGDVPLTGRDRSAASQQAVDRAARRLGVARPRPQRTAADHLAAARSALEHGGAAVAIEPVALAAGLDFAELELHDSELWVPARRASHPGVQALIDLLGTAAFRDRAGALPAYDLADTGTVR